MPGAQAPGDTRRPDCPAGDGDRGQDGFARIGPVYTPPDRRGRGYAAGVTARAARAILDAGATPCLFTDLANPTSNGVYQRIGFEPVLDTVTVRIDRPSAR